MLGVINGLADAVGGGANPRNPAKLKIDMEGKEIKLPHLFNPADLKVTRKVTWKAQQGSDADGAQGAPYYVFGGGTDTLTFTLHFDCSEEKDAHLGDEVEALYDLTYPYTTVKSQKAKRAQLCTVTWKDFKFTGVVDSVDITITLFDHEGRFKRATVVMALQGYAFDRKGLKADKFFEEPREKEKAKEAKEPKAGGSNPLSGIF